VATPASSEPSVSAQAQQRAVEFLGAAAAERQAGRLSAALDLAQQALGAWPDYADARQFRDEVAGQATATATAAVAQATARAAQTATTQAGRPTATAAPAAAAPARVATSNPSTSAAPASQQTAGRPFVYGVTIADASPDAGRSFDLARRAGFTHAYVVVNWGNLQPGWGRFAWETGQPNDLDNFLRGARAHGLRLVVRLSKPHDWPGALSDLDPATFERFAAGVAARARGVGVAYEVLNEPNLQFEWGGPPDPAAYARLLAAAARGIRRGDPQAVVLSAGLAPYTGNQPGTIEDVDFLRAMYTAGARGSFDALGIHPYGGTASPDGGDPECGICFRRAERYRQVMVEAADAATPAWITELGYLHTTGTPLGPYEWLKVSPQQQATYLATAFQYAYNTWPWLSGIVVFNLDFATVPWNPATSGAYWFGLLNPDRSPRPAYTALRDMPKPGALAFLAG
jgi:hypothetical protein